MGNNSNKSTSLKNALKIDKKDEDILKLFFNTYLENGNYFNLTKFNHEVFLNLSVNSIFYLNDYYIKKNIDKKIDNLDLSDLLNIFYLLTKANQYDEEDSGMSIYYRKNTFLILYDMYMGYAGAFEKEINLVKLADVFDFIVQIYINQHLANSQDKGETMSKNMFDYDKNNLINFLKNNLKIKQKENNINILIVENSSLISFIDSHLYSLDSFIKNYFRVKFLQNEQSLSSSIPICTESPSTVSIDQLLFLILANPNLGSMKYAFKLYDCQKTGYNIPNLIYSFIGFPGPIKIFIKNYDKETGREIVLGAFLNSNLKECYEKFCGDESSFIFELHPRMHFYKFVGDAEKICFISSKNQKFSKVTPGIGLGYSKGKCRFWIDSNECFKKSYFNKFDDVFEDGTPFDNSEHFLNIVNIEVYGFGNEDTYESLIKKQNKDKVICEKMKKIDKAKLVENEFDKEMFFDSKFGNQK